MEGMSNKSMKIIVFTIIGIISLIIFMALSASMNSESDIPQVPSTSDKEINDPIINEKKYELYRIKVDKECENNENCMITLNTYEKENNEYSFIYKKDEKETLSLDSNLIYEFSSSPIEFISFESDFILVKYDNKIELIDESGKILLFDNNIQSELEINDEVIEYETLDCNLKNGYLYKANLINLNGKPKIILTDKLSQTNSACN